MIDVNAINEKLRITSAALARDLQTHRRLSKLYEFDTTQLARKGEFDVSHIIARNGISGFLRKP
jgi:hypothetical protein